MYSKRGKYGAIKTTFMGVVYASKLEAAYARELWISQKAGKIVAVETQVPFVLVPKPNLVKYVADFVVVFKDGRREVHEVKGFSTPAWKIKEKLFRHLYPDLPLIVVH